MRILIVVEEFSRDRGYMEYYLAIELVKLGHKVCILTSKYNSSLKNPIVTEGFEVLIIPQLLGYHGYNLPSVRGIIDLVHIVKHFRPNLVICNPVFSPLSLVVLNHPILSTSIKIGNIVSGGPIVVTTGLYSMKSFSSLLRYLFAKLVIEKIVAHRLNGYLTLTNQLKEYLLKHLNIDDTRFIVMPLGADPSLFKFDENSRSKVRQTLRFSDQDVIVVYTGRITHERDIPLLVNAFACLVKELPSSKMLIVGDGDEFLLDFIKERCIQLGIEQEVVFIPTVHRTELPAIYSACDIAVWPGGPTISIAEAASVGLPLIIRNSPMSQYLIANENGFVIKRGDEKDLADKLKLLLTNSSMRRSMGKKSRELIVEKLNWTSITTELINNVHKISKSTR